MTAFLEKRLKLRVNLGKSAVARPRGRKFLGYTLRKAGDTIHARFARESERRLRDRVRVAPKPLGYYRRAVVAGRSLCVPPLPI